MYLHRSLLAWAGNVPLDNYHAIAGPSLRPLNDSSSWLMPIVLFLTTLSKFSMTALTTLDLKSSRLPCHRVSSARGDSSRGDYCAISHVCRSLGPEKPKRNALGSLWLRKSLSESVQCVGSRPLALPATPRSGGHSRCHSPWAPFGLARGAIQRSMRGHCADAGPRRLGLPTAALRSKRIMAARRTRPVRQSRAACEISSKTTYFIECYLTRR
jgi:hypothetical protein